jgi:hypothetical protein
MGYIQSIIGEGSPSVLVYAKVYDSVLMFDSRSVGYYTLRFFNMDPNYVFDSRDCSIYGKKRGEGFLFCVGSSNSTIMAGAFL